MPHYRIHVPLDACEGASGVRYTCSPGALVEAAEGEFDGLPEGAATLYTEASPSPHTETLTTETLTTEAAPLAPAPIARKRKTQED